MNLISPNGRADQMCSTLNAMPIGHLRECPRHLHGYKSARHLGIAANRHIVIEKHIQIRLALPFADFQHQAKHSVEYLSNNSFSIIELTYGIIHADLAAPASVRDRVEIVPFFIDLDLPALS